MLATPPIEKYLLEVNFQSKIVSGLLKELLDKEVVDSDIHISDSAEIPCMIIPLSNTEQDTREGYNKLLLNYGDSSVSVNGVTASYNKLTGKFKVTGIPTADTWINIFPIFQAGTNESVAGDSINVSEKYLVTNYDKWSSASNIALQFTDGLTVTNLNTLGEKYKKFSTDTANRGWIYIPNSGENLNEEFWVMICDNYNYTEYEQYGSMPSIEYPSPVRVVEGSYENKVQNKNLFDNVFRLGGWTSESNEPVTRLYNKNKLKLKAGISYTISTNLDISKYKYAINLNLTGYPTSVGHLYDSGWITSNSFTFIPKEDYYLGVPIATLNGTDIIDLTALEGVWFQVKEEDTQTDYTPHAEQTYNLDFPEGMQFAEGDEIECSYTEKNGYKTIDSMYHIGNSKEYVFTGDELLVLTQNGKGINYFYTDTTLLDNASSIIYSNYFKSYDDIWNVTEKGDYIKVSHDKLITINIMAKDYEVVDDFKAKLKELYNTGTPLKVRYFTTTPTRTQITNENFINQYEALLNSSTYKGVTNITTTKQSDIQSALNLKVIYKQSNKLVINNLEKEIEELKALILES